MDIYLSSACSIRAVRLHQTTGQSQKRIGYGDLTGITRNAAFEHRRADEKEQRPRV